MTNFEIVEGYKMENNIEGDMLTFNIWSKKGYQIKKGEKAHSIQLWKKVKIKVVDKDNKETEKSKFIMVNCKMFSENQVIKK